MRYSEDYFATTEQRKAYLKSVEDFGENLKSKHLGKLPKGDFGYPISDLKKTGKTSIRLEKDVLLSKEDGYEIHRMTFDVIGLKLTGLYFKVNETLPLVIMQHGFLGTPEVLSNVYEDRETYNYNNIVRRLLNSNVNVFCPQLLMWHIEKYGVPYDRTVIDSELRESGTCLVGMETYELAAVIDWFRENVPSLPYIDMFGMSYGAYYTYRTAFFTEGKIHNYAAFNFAISTIEFHEQDNLVNDCEIIKTVTSWDNFYVSYGDHDPVIKHPESEEVLKNARHVRVFVGDHEIIKDDDYLKSII